ncbi:hypothetical protein IK146_01275 [Candidatus Saccharibacteria bacterium]|nr:hypothetical protein [Candidatus Saccharibacteria bacterium]
MEKRIKAYEKYIAKETSKDLSAKEREELIEYHREMVANFQRERIIHLLIMLFFVAVSLVLIGILVWTILELGFVLEMSAYYALVLIMVGLTIAYVRHYYFLENHVQALYDYTKILMIESRK